MKAGEMKDRPRQYLEQWLREYSLGSRMSIADDGEEDGRGPWYEGSVPAACCRQALPASGQVRLLSRRRTESKEPPRYVALLEGLTAEQGHLSVVPFSRYSVPAFEGEMLLREHGALSLRTLCLWNFHEVPASVLDRSYLADTLSEEEHGQVLDALDALCRTGTMPDWMQSVTGAPVVRLGDPRRGYRQREKELFNDALGAETRIMVDGCSTLIDLSVFMAQNAEDEWMMAAAEEDRNRRLNVRYYRSGDDAIRVAISECEDPGLLAVEVRRDENARLEGGALVDEAGCELARIENGCALLDRVPNMRITLVTLDGKAVELQCNHYE
jgi:hypothetical protein